MPAVSRAQCVLLLHHAQAFYDFSVAKRIAFIDSSLIGCCACFPLLAELTLPASQMVDDFFCLFGIHGAANVAWHIIGTHQPGEVITREVELDKLNLAVV